MCSKKTFNRCAAPVVEALAAAGARCQSDCADPDSAPCHACLDPAVTQATTDLASCRDAVCLGGVDESEEAPAPAGAAAGQRAGGATTGMRPCDSINYIKCRRRNNQNFQLCAAGAAAACLTGVAGCALGLWVCVGQYRMGEQACQEDFGCKGGAICTRNVCCPPSGTQVGCGGACCDYDGCQRCVNEVCEFQCLAPKVCNGSDACVCPRGTTECLAADPANDTCCVKSKCETCQGGTCTSCQPPRVCHDGTCTCPKGTKPCGSRDCCGKDQICYDGGCACLGGVPCGANCCDESQDCDDATGECKTASCAGRPDGRTQACASGDGQFIICCMPCAQCCSGQNGAACCQPGDCGGSHCSEDDLGCVGGTESCPCDTCACAPGAEPCACNSNQ